MNPKRTSQLCVDAGVWILVSLFIVASLIGAVLEFLVKAVSLNWAFNTPLHQRVAFHYNTLHNRCIRTVVGGMVGLTWLYNRFFGEKYFVRHNLAVVNPESENFSQPRNSVVISSFRFGITKPAPRQNRVWSWKKPWQLPQERHDANWFVLNWKLRYNISVEFKIWKWKALSWWGKRWLRVHISPHGVLYRNYPHNTSVRMYTDTDAYRRFWWIVKMPSFLSSLFAPQRYDLVNISSFTTNGMTRSGYSSVRFEIEHTPLKEVANPPTREFCVLCLLIGTQPPHPRSPVIQRLRVYTIPTLEYIQWCLFRFPYAHGHEHKIDYHETVAARTVREQKTNV